MAESIELRLDCEYRRGPDLSVGGAYSRSTNIKALMDRYSWMKVEQKPLEGTH